MSVMFVWVGKDAEDVMVIGQMVSAELYLYLAKFHLYWLKCAVSAEFVTRLIRTTFAI